MVCIGVTGHRSLRLVDRLETGIHLALDQIERTFPCEEWLVISSLAEGADRLALLKIWKYKPKAQLIVPLPLPVEEYEHDFRSGESRREFRALINRAAEVIYPIPTLTRREAYREAGLQVLQHSQVLLALWDGKPARSLGGTAEMVALARQQCLPLAWVRCGNCTSLGEDQGHVSFEGFLL